MTDQLAFILILQGQLAELLSNVCLPAFDVSLEWAASDLQLEADAANQKRALSILQTGMAPGIWQEEPWSSFEVLYSLLDEFAPYLIQVV